MQYHGNIDLNNNEITNTHNVGFPYLVFHARTFGENRPVTSFVNNTRAYWKLKILS